MTFGCEEEIAISGEDVSPFFKGGNDSVHCCITLSSPHNGTQVANILYDPGFTVYGVSFLYNVIGSTLGNNFLVFSLQMSHFGLTPAQGESHTNINMRSVREYYYAEDNCYYDLTIRGAKELNEKILITSAKTSTKNTSPIILLDDVFSDLDSIKKNNLLKHINKKIKKNKLVYLIS